MAHLIQLILLLILIVVLQILSILHDGTYFEQFFDVIVSIEIEKKAFFKINVVFKFVDHFIFISASLKKFF